FQESIVDEQESNKDENIHLRRFLRVLANVLIICCLCGSGYLIYFVVKRSQTFSKMQNVGWYERNEVRKLCFQFSAGIICFGHQQINCHRPRTSSKAGGFPTRAQERREELNALDFFKHLHVFYFLMLAEEDVVKNITHWTLLGHHNSSAGNDSTVTPPPLDPADVPRGPCWETTVGIVRTSLCSKSLCWFGMVQYFLLFFSLIFVNYCWCWDLEAGFVS
ncbi:TMC2 protein, partial [Panurus biarmicus]|nr:TMC2 protein [Panurus biarmicus]